MTWLGWPGRSEAPTGAQTPGLPIPRAPRLLSWRVQTVWVLLRKHTTLFPQAPWATEKGQGSGCSSRGVRRQPSAPPRTFCSMSSIPSALTPVSPFLSSQLNPWSPWWTFPLRGLWQTSLPLPWQHFQCVPVPEASSLLSQALAVPLRWARVCIFWFSLLFRLKVLCSNVPVLFMLRLRLGKQNQAEQLICLEWIVIHSLALDNKVVNIIIIINYVSFLFTSSENLFGFCLGPCGRRFAVCGPWTTKRSENSSGPWIWLGKTCFYFH